MELALAEQLSQAPVFVRRLDGKILYWTTGAQELYGFGFDAAVGRASHELLQTVFPEPLEEIDRKLRRDGVWQGLLGHTKADKTLIWVQSRWRLKDSDSAEGAIVVESNSDVTQRETLSRELDHRVKNTLAVVQGLARLTFRRDGQGVREFEERLSALARVHDVLLSHHFNSAGLLEVVERALAGLGIRDRVSLDGEDVMLRPGAVLAYLLAFHELAVNALKHGSLLAPGGRVDISWQIYSDDRVRVVWRERGGPRPSEDRASGSGMALLNRFVAAELGGPVNLSFADDGLICEFDGPTQKESSLPRVE